MSEIIHGLLEDLHLICSSEHNMHYLSSLFPLVTHVSPHDDEFDIDEFRDMMRERMIMYISGQESSMHANDSSWREQMEDFYN